MHRQFCPNTQASWHIQNTQSITNIVPWNHFLPLFGSILTLHRFFPLTAMYCLFLPGKNIFESTDHLKNCLMPFQSRKRPRHVVLYNSTILLSRTCFGLFWTWSQCRCQLLFWLFQYYSSKTDLSPKKLQNQDIVSFLFARQTQIRL